MNEILAIKNVNFTAPATRFVVDGWEKSEKYFFGFCFCVTWESDWEFKRLSARDASRLRFVVIEIAFNSTICLLRISTARHTFSPIFFCFHLATHFTQISYQISFSFFQFRERNFLNKKRKKKHKKRLFNF